MAGTFSGGPLSIDDLLALWRQVTDSAYADAFIQAGEGNGLEAWTQGFAQHARVSTAIDTTLQALYILPWSGQSSEPASGPVCATATMSFSRSGRLNEPLVLGAGLVFFDEVAPDASPRGTQRVATGRRYTLQSDLVFQPGQSGPLLATIVAEKPGYGFNNPIIGSINTTEQPGTQYSNVDAAIIGALPCPLGGATAVASLVVADAPDIVIPQHVGQYVELLTGSAAGSAFRMVGYGAPQPLASPPQGGTATLEYLITMQSATYSGEFIPGEIVDVYAGASLAGQLRFMASLILPDASTSQVASFVYLTGIMMDGLTLTGTQSGAQMDVDILLNVPRLLPATGIAWRVLDWVADWGLSVSNTTKPSGGKSGMLDMLGLERGMYRFVGESDESYRKRISAVSDTVSPNAIRRKLNRALTLSPLALSWCFREVGTSSLPGFFYSDGQTVSGVSVDGLFAYDNDMLSTYPQTSTAFVNGETVYQVSGGVRAEGRAVVNTPINWVVPTFYPPIANGSPITLADVPSPPNLSYFMGVANVRGEFVTGLPIVGETSGASMTPTTILGGVTDTTRYAVLLDYLRFRAYFVVNVQRSDAGDFGFAWGIQPGAPPGVGGLVDAYDAGPRYNDFYDGVPLQAGATVAAAYQAIDQIRAGGVYFEFAAQDFPCA